MEIKNLSEMSILNNFNFTAYEIDLSRMDINQNNRDTSLYEYSVYANNKMFRKGNASKFNDKNDQSGSVRVNWVGFRDHYHALIIKPEFETKSYEIKSDSNQQLNVSIRPQDKNLAPGESISYDFSIYDGPQNPWLMKKYQKGFEKIVAFSNFIIIEWIGQAIYYTIPVLHSIFRSWGVAIILISMMIYGITYPLTMQSMMSMRKMQQVQPKIAALRERYKSDPQKLNAEMVEIYRREKINPFGGCLPFLIQMPFFMALYQILWRAQYFQGQGFLWIKDLSQPDRLIILPFYLPFFGNELNILPVLTGCIMFLQQRISSKNMVVTDEQQAMQQKMMMYILPVMMTFMFYKFASSWAIYFLVFYILSTATQWKIAKLAGKKASQ
jgi:YidC/Oxa1 family membrane protein insertase